jgi:cysteine desulfurase
MQGGAQERQRRAGTENVAGAAGFATAMEASYREAPATALRDRLIDALTGLAGVELTGHPTERLPNSASFVIEGIEGGDLVAALDLEDIHASTGSACTTGSVEPSHVLLAMGVDEALAHGSLRLTLGPETTAAHVERTVSVVEGGIARLRASAAQVAASA